MTIRTGVGPRGMALVSVLMLAAVAALAAFTLAAVVVSGLHMATREVNGQKALYLAEASVTDTIAQIHGSLQNGTSVSLDIIVPLPASPSSTGHVTFNQQVKAMPYSVNNVQGGNGPVPGYFPGSQVPSGSADIIGVGNVNGTVRTVEAVVTVPPFPYALAVSGPFTCTGTLSVTGSPSMAAAAATPLPNASPTPAMPASLGCNAAVTVTGPPSTITGNVVAAGAVSLPSGSSVGGQIEKKAVLIPTVSVSTYDPGPSYPAPAPTPGGMVVNQWCYQGSNLTVPGNLYMQNGALYVYGDLTINGGIQGTGDIFVTGRTIVNGGADLDAANLVALLGDGDVTLTGPGAGQKYFQGLVYTQGNFTASNITVMGAFVASGSSASMSLTNAPVVYVPSAVTIAPVPRAGSWFGVDSNGGLGRPTFSQVQNSVTSIDMGGSNVLENITPQEQAIYNGLVAGLGANADFNSYLSFTTPGTGSVIETGTISVKGTDGNMYTLTVSATGYNTSGGGFSPTQTWQAVSPPSISFTKVGNPITQSAFDAGVVGGQQIYLAPVGPQVALGTVSVPNLAQRLIPLMEQAQALYMALAIQYGPATTTTGPTPPPMPNLTINNFLGDADPVQIVFWRER